MDLAARVLIRSDVMGRQVGDEIVLLDLASGTYFGLDPVGARIWQLIGDGNTIRSIYETLLADYDVTPGQLLEDVRNLLDELQARRLVSVT